jgi:hypothetical protein
MTSPQVPSHERFEADLAELAVGVLDRTEEVALLNHLVSCSSCADKFERLTSAANSLLLLALEVDPPDGFETRFRKRMSFCGSGVCHNENLFPLR